MTTAETKTRASRQAATSARLTARSSSNAALSPTQAQQQPAYSLGQAPGVQLQRNLLQPQTAPPEELEQEESGQAEMPVQAKVVVGAPNDPYEQEADEVAEQVLRGQPAPSITPLTPGAQSPAAQAQREEREDADEHDNAPLEEPEELAQPLLQMQSDEESATATDETERPEELIQPWFVQRKCGCQGACNCGAANQGGEQERDGQVQTDAAPASRAPQPNTAAVSQALREQGGGAPLNAGVQQTLETHTGYDLSDVRVHQGQPAQLANRDLHARAFTHGNNIWLGSGESSDDLRLLAHEVTHVVQQNSASGDIQTLQRKPSDYQHPEDGGAVGGRLNQRFDEIDEDERPEEKPAVNRAELRQESSGLRGATKPDVNRPAQEQPRVEQSASVVEREAESPPDPLVKGEAASEPEGKGEGGEGKAMGAAEQAAALAAQSMAVANSQTEPGPETEVQPPEPVEPVDAAGEPLEADPEAEGALANLADRAQFLRAQGTLMRAQAAEGRSNAEITRANLAKVTGEIGQAEEGITKSQDHAAYRREVVGQAEQALGVSEEKQAKVAAESPEYTAKADEG